jgi:cell division protein FtsW (lipid II flippase)
MSSEHAATGFEVETLAFFLTTVGLSVAASAVPEDMVKQFLLVLAGILLFFVLGWWLRDLRRVKSLRWFAAAAALGLLGLNLLIGTELFGARNWIEVAGFSLQPSEFVKIAYIYTGAATLDRLFMGRNLFVHRLSAPVRARWP